jgi:hypothetical protein
MLVVVACVDGLRRTLPEDALLNRIIERMADIGHVVPAGTLRGSGRDRYETGELPFE